MSLTLPASPLPVFLALLTSILVGVRLFQTRSLLSGLAALHNRSITYASLGIFGSFSLFTIGSYFPEVQLTFHWISILVFLLSYVSLLYGTALAKAIIPITFAFVPLVLPPLSYGLVFAFLGLSIFRDRTGVKFEVCEYDHEEIGAGGFCRLCGKISTSIEQGQAHSKTIRGLAFIGLLALVFNVSYIPTFVVDDERFVFARYTSEGLLTEDIIQIRDSNFMIVEGSLALNSIPLATATSEATELVPLERSMATLETYHLDDDSGRTVNLMTITRVLPYIDDLGNLASDQLNVYILGGAEPGRVVELKDQLIGLGDQINQRLLIPIELTPWLQTFSTMFSQSLPFLLSAVVATSLLISTIWIRRMEVERDHKISLTSSFPRSLGLIALIALSARFRERLRGKDLYDNARKMGYDGNVKQIVADLSELERRDFLSSKFVLHRGNLLKVWTTGT